MILAGVDLAWQSERNPTAIAFGELSQNSIKVVSVIPAVYGIENVLKSLTEEKQLCGVAIDASLIINNASGLRPCEKQVSKVYGARNAGCHPTNTTLYPAAGSVYLSQQLIKSGFHHLGFERWQIECYPHPSIIEIFNLPERLKYKKGVVAEKRRGQRLLAGMLRNLFDSPVLTLAVDETDCAILDDSAIDLLRGQALKTNEDCLDALVCLYTAGLYALGHNGRIFGDTSTGYVWIPQSACVTEANV